METSHDRDLSGGRDLESASEMEAFMNEIASGPSPSDQLGDTQDGESSAETVQTAVSLTPILGRKSSDGRRRGPFAKDDAADYDEEQGTVVGRARRRSSVRRRSGAKVSEGRRDSKGILEKINDGVRAVAPELRRRSSSLMRHGRQYSTATTAAASTTSFQKARRASLLNVAMRSKAAAAAVAGCHDDEVADTEADADAADREMSKWNLEFRDPILETAFRRHYRSWVIPRIRVGIQIQMALHLLFGALELSVGYADGAVMPTMFLRLAILVAFAVFSWDTLDNKFHRRMDPVSFGVYMLVSLLLVAIDLVASVRGTAVDTEGVPVYFFFEGRWSLPSSLMFVVVVYHTSGLRFRPASIVAWNHYVFMWVAMLSSACCENGFWSLFTQEAGIVPVLMVLSMISSYTVEKQIRVDFVLRCHISSERVRADEICSSMLPPSISERLKDGSRVEDVLQEYPEITILFCYITGFKELTTSCDPYDVVDFVNALFSNFDKCTDFHHVYKLEAIDCSYLCCAGGGQEGYRANDGAESGQHGEDNWAPAADRALDMALTMLAVAAHGSKLPAAVGSSEAGGTAVLKIGIHTGRHELYGVH